ncbi:phenylalanine--tRNA ligase subunit beta [Persicimonas caeni]|uniref:Phenylalanine--tRNA ligase beta subunit n=1 Tax=Persicimonas caeni TaxID=2292766 RepID=A0A4Y6PND2_PERCE|nr:phenylalanine--tRNA ligase subunit beta [Persicimonas caeni]QDG49794.1 phenylalanine--tRNA ligase subunit beta [Persicimonas caeni]QED31015.1 phenylalanine--tRNA ligase subunit beta [Persicimonas caeni]
MKVSWNWLQEWVDLDGLAVDEVVHRLTMAGLEVDGVERLGEGADDIVVARIDQIREHPNADKLVLCDVDYGADEFTQVVCGAKNMGEGDYVPLALPGSSPPGVDFEIVSRKVRGEMSSGMLCSADELDLEEESDGLLLLPKTLELGRPVFEALDLKEVVIEIDLTPNRPDCLGHMGVARELAALYGRELKTPESFGGAAPWEGEGDQATDAAPLTVEDADGCPRYLFAVMEDVKVGPSPAWLKARLAAVGLRSVNNIVDVTNYVLMELNQPLHAFDLDELSGPEIRVRRAGKGETMVGIDHNEYELDPADLVIADSERPVAIAGVMGGEETEVGDETTRILIECAYFDPTTVRKSAKRHSLHTDSSHRFERGIDPAGLPKALARAVRLMVKAQEHLGAEPKVRAGIAEATSEGVTEPATTVLAKGLSERVLGANLTEQAVEEHLTALGIALVEQDSAWACTIPTYRPDLTRPIDLVEEVARMHGYDNIPEQLPRSSMGYAHTIRPDAEERPTIVSRPDRDVRNRIRTQLLSFGLFEVVNYGFMSPEDLDVLRLAEGDRRRETVDLANPLIASDRHMQTTLVPGLLDNLQTNLAQRTHDVTLFEFGRRYFPDEERPTLALLMSGRKEQHWSGDSEWDFFDLKGVIEAICRPFATGELEWQVPSEQEPYLHPGVQAEWSGGDNLIARAGRLHPAVAAELDVEQDVLVAEVYLDALFELGRREMGYTALSRYPAVTHDFALLYDLDAHYADLEGAVERLATENDEFGRIFESVELFDVYSGEQVAEGKRSLALSVVYRSSEKTLTDEDVERADNLLVDWLEGEVGATLR